MKTFKVASRTVRGSTVTHKGNRTIIYPEILFIAEKPFIVIKIDAVDRIRACFVVSKRTWDYSTGRGGDLTCSFVSFISPVIRKYSIPGAYR